MDPSTYPSSAPPYSSAIALAFFSLLLVFLITPSATWHVRNRNIGASSLVIIVLIKNFMSFLNAVIWPADNLSAWFSGHGLCDIQVKIQVASHVLIPAAAACMLRALARVMDTNRTTLGLSKSQKRKDMAIELVLCLGLPLLQMLAHYIVQPSRYYVYGIAGCVPTVDSSWPTVVLVLLPPVFLTIIDAYYAILIIIRLSKYRRAFTSIMANSNMTKSRFMRLFLICLVVIFASIPAQVYVFYTVLQWDWLPFSWSAIHSAEGWSEIVMIPSDGTIFYDRYIWLGEGIVMFLLFGVGKDAFKMYKNGMLAMGFGKCMPWLRADQRSTTTGNSFLASVNSKAKSLLQRKSVVSTWFGSKASQSTSFTDSSTEDSPKKLTFTDIMEQDSPRKQKPRPSPLDLEANSQQPPSRLSRWTRFFRLGNLAGGNAKKQSETLALGSIMTNHTITVSSEVKGGEISPTYLRGHDRGRSKDEIYVKRELRQASVAAEGEKPVQMYEGV
ncbi:hypothetical protein MBLNU230_g8071t1 [Neophaeotheca triangularis]